MWVVGAAAVWLVGACAVAVLVGAVLRRGCAAEPLPDDVGVAIPPVVVPAQRSASPATPPYGMRSQAHMTCASVRPGH